MRFLNLKLVEHLQRMIDQIVFFFLRNRLRRSFDLRLMYENCVKHNDTG